STTNPLPNDNGLGTPIGTAHYNLWRSNFGSTYSAAAWVNGNRAIFSAGTNATASTASNGLTSDISGNLGTTGTTGVPALSGMIIEEGEINVLGTLTLAGTSGAT